MIYIRIILSCLYLGTHRYTHTQRDTIWLSPVNLWSRFSSVLSSPRTLWHDELTRDQSHSLTVIFNQVQFLVVKFSGVKQITSMKFRLWEVCWNNEVKAAELIWDAAAGNLGKNHDSVGAVKSFWAFCIPPNLSWELYAKLGAECSCPLS